MPYALLDELMTTVGEPSASASVDFTGHDPIFPTPLRLGEAGAATIAAAAVQAARLFELTTGQTQRVSLEVDAAAAAMRSSRYLRVGSDGPDRPTRGGGGLGVYRTRDERWMYFQRLFPHHRQRIFAVLDCLDQEDAITTAVSRWDGLALEEAIVAAGACGGLVRPAAEWQSHPQAHALARLPLLEVLRVGDSPPEPLTPGARPLSTVRVLDVTRVLAGPTCARTLAEHGADVLRVGTPRLPDNAGMMHDTGFGKRSTALDLSSWPDAERLHGLIRDADVFAQGYRPGTLAARGFSVEHVAAERPGIVYVSISAFGHEGPWQARRGFDSVVQAVNGIADEHTAADGRPRFAPANPLDYMTGYLAAFGAMVALGRRARDGGSFHVRVSLAQTGQWLASLPRMDPDLVAARPTELSAERLAELTMVTETPFGRLRHLKPAAHLSETPPYWELPSVPLDHDPPEWR